LELRTAIAGLLPHVAQAAIREGWVDVVGMGRMILTYPELLHDASEGKFWSTREFAERSAIARPAHAEGIAVGMLPAVRCTEFEDGKIKNSEGNDADGRNYSAEET